MAEDAFSRWFRADEHPDGKGFEYPGVYIAARFTTAPGMVDPASPDVLYVGECTGQSLRVRTGNFVRVLTGRSVKNPAGVHCGAANLLKVLRAPVPRTELFLAVLPCRLGPPRASALVKLREREVLWNFVCRNNRLPLGNKE
jgi:hypothetical protein